MTAEIVLSAAWHSGAVPSDLTTVDGQSLEVIHRGAWSHGLGPNFRDTLILFDGRELRAGCVEVHLQTRGWKDHGHHLDPAYDAVVLHVVGQHDGAETRRHDGALVPVVDIGPLAPFATPTFAAWDWDRVGGHSCAEHLARTTPRVVRETLARMGDVRLATRSARIEARLATQAPGEILWCELLDGLGFAANREPMRRLAHSVPLAAIEDLLFATPRYARIDVARGVLLGAAGFLPLSPIDGHSGQLTPDAVAALEAAWHKSGHPWRTDTIAPSAWRRARVRPANHPVPRLLAAASILNATSREAGLLATILGTLRDANGPVASLQTLSASQGIPGIGIDRALDIIASSVIPFALALADHTGDAGLADATSAQWERLPAPAMNAITRRAARQVAGAAPLGKIGARGAQGLLHLDTTLCQPRRCFECPVAAAALAVND
ncbi:MAG: DUF2851 family protein [Chloroflexia bacterium]|nr:DUF2851 family protein [Chloroflexia bacterium]